MKWLTAKFFFLCAIFVFLVLLAKNPYSERTLIPNLEPYPDTLHYIVPARSLVSGKPFKIIREGRELNPSVPPAYSFSLIPFYLINNDPRMFYFANVSFSLISLYLLFLIVKKITGDKWVIGLTLFIFSTNYYMYWYSQWAMAENLLLPIFLGAVFLLTIPAKTENVLLASFIPLLVYSTKYAFLPLSIAFAGMFTIKIYLQGKKSKFKQALFFLLLTGLFFAPVLIYQSYMQGINPLARYFHIFVGILPFVKGSVVSVDQYVGPSGWFSREFFLRNYQFYLEGLAGAANQFLWDFTPILPKYLIYPAWIGLIFGVINKRLRFISISLIVLLLFHLLFISAFRTTDMRYIYHSIPTLLLGFCLFLTILKDILEEKKLYPLFLLLVFLMGGFYVLKNVQRIRYQAVLNLKYAETPWYYISVLKLNDYFSEERTVEGEKPYVISPMPPYYIDFFSNGNYRLLPLSPAQEFRSGKVQAWGDYNYSDLHGVYRKLLEEGGQLYVSTYGLGNEAYLHRAFDDLSNDFVLKEVSNNCYELCKIYKLELKNGKNI